MMYACAECMYACAECMHACAELMNARAVCMCVYMCVCMYAWVRMYMCVYVGMHVRRYHIWMYVCTYRCIICVRVSTCVSTVDRYSGRAGLTGLANLGDK